MGLLVNELNRRKLRQILFFIVFLGTYVANTVGH